MIEATITIINLIPYFENQGVVPMREVTTDNLPETSFENESVLLLPEVMANQMNIIDLVPFKEKNQNINRANGIDIVEKTKNQNGYHNQLEMAENNQEIEPYENRNEYVIDENGIEDKNLSEVVVQRENNNGYQKIDLANQVDNYDVITLERNENGYAMKESNIYPGNATIDITSKTEEIVDEPAVEVETKPDEVIYIKPEEEISQTNQIPDYTGGENGNGRGGALTTSKGSFSTFLAPLNKASFKEVVTDVEKKLLVVNQTLNMLIHSAGFETVLEEMLSSIALKTGELLGADRTTIFLLDSEKNELWSIVAKDDGGGSLEIRIPADKGIGGEVAVYKKVVNIPYDFFDDPRSIQSKKMFERTGYRTYTMLALPLLEEEKDQEIGTEQELVAVVQLLNKLKTPNDPNRPLEERIDLEGFTEKDEKLFEEFAPSIRLILQSSRSFYVATQKQRAADALMKANQALSQSSLDLEETLKRVMDEAKKLMNADRSTLWLIDHEKDQLWTKLPIGGELKEIRIPRTAGFAGMVAQSGEPLMISFDIYDDPRSKVAKETDQKTGYRTCSMLCMPVFNNNDELIGVTQLVNKKRQGEFPKYNPADWPKAPECWKASFNRSDQEFMQIFNIQAGVALQNAKLFAEVKQQQQMQKDILRSLSNGVISTDKAGVIIAANESAKRLIGLDENEKIEGKQVYELVKIKNKEDKIKNEENKQLDVNKFTQWFDNALEAKEEKKRQQYYPDQLLETVDKEQHSVNLSINTILDASDDSKVRGALVVMEDISHEKRLKSTMYRYMTQEVAEQLLARGDDFKMGGDRKEVYVLFSDIRSYTTLTESLEAEEVVQMLNEYFELMVEAVFKHRGTLDKYIGDAIMAVFGAFVPLEDHAWKAVQTAVEMRHRLAQFNEDRRQKSLQEIKIGIGINSDVVISGNIGSSQRMELTSIGDGVNLGSRLESASKQYGCDIVISETTFKECEDKIWYRKLDYIRVKGKTQPVSIYELVGLIQDTEYPIPDWKKKQIEVYQKGREYYFAHQFRLAQNEFGTILDDMRIQDKAAAMYMKRCQPWLEHPEELETSWDDGVWTLTEK